ncbi:hypothetical protein N9B96_02790 [Gammaproteobacteria bacterium]|nr:hypothetical protein [Gammaproteobacteria bacterium]
MITEKEEELFAAKLRRFEKTLGKIVAESRENFKLSEGPAKSAEIDHIKSIGRSLASSDEEE